MTALVFLRACNNARSTEEQQDCWLVKEREVISQQRLETSAGLVHLMKTELDRLLKIFITQNCKNK